MSYYYYEKEYKDFAKAKRRLATTLYALIAGAILFLGVSLFGPKNEIKTEEILTASVAPATPQPTPFIEEPVVVVENFRNYLSEELEANIDAYLAEDENHTCEDLEARGLTLGSQLRLRKGPGTDYDIVTEVGKDVYLQVLGVCDNDWYLVNTGGRIGFMTGEYLRVITDEYLESQIVEPTTHLFKGIRANTTVNVRDAANTDGGILGSLSTGQNAIVLGREANGWYRIQYGSYTGYVCGDYVSEVYASSMEDLPAIYIREDAPFSEEPYDNPTMTLGANQFVRMYGQNDDYYLVEYKGEYGYVPKEDCERMTDYYVIVDVNSFTLRAFHLGEEVLKTQVGVGAVDTPTPTGCYNICRKMDSDVMFGDTINHVLYFEDYRGIAIHDGVGTGRVSHSCVRTPEDQMAILFPMMNVGDNVFVVDSYDDIAGPQYAYYNH